MRLLILTLILSTTLVAFQDDKNHCQDDKNHQTTSPNYTDGTKSSCVLGLVTDSNGLRAIGATVTLMDVEVAKSQSTSTDSNGSYVFCSLAAGAYTLSATKGIAKADTKCISLKKDERSSVHLVLSLKP